MEMKIASWSVVTVMKLKAAHTSKILKFIATQQVSTKSIIIIMVSQHTCACVTQYIGTPNGELHLTGGLTQYERVVKIFISGTWQHICFDDWNDPDARVVCRQMGYLSTFTNGT